MLIHGPGSWTRSEIQQTPADEIYEHLVLSRRADAERKRFAIAVACFPKTKRVHQKEIQRLLDEQYHTGSRFLKPSQQVDDDTRVLIIGSELSIYGKEWADNNRDEIAWLAFQGIEPDEAIARHRAWLDAERRHPFWRPGKSSTRRGEMSG